jgi:hypothetical protein
VSAVAEASVRELYGRYKHLALAAGAALLLEEPVDGLVADAAALAGEARDAAAAEGAAHASQLRACADAASELRELLVRGGDDVGAARRAHKHLRREVWKVVPCEYVPCCASAPHGREGEECDG